MENIAEINARNIVRAREIIAENRIPELWSAISDEVNLVGSIPTEICMGQKISRLSKGRHGILFAKERLV